MVAPLLVKRPAAPLAKGVLAAVGPGVAGVVELRPAGPGCQQREQGQPGEPAPVFNKDFHNSEGLIRYLPTDSGLIGSAGGKGLAQQTGHLRLQGWQHAWAAAAAHTFRACCWLALMSTSVCGMPERHGGPYSACVTGLPAVRPRRPRGLTSGAGAPPAPGRAVAEEVGKPGQWPTSPSGHKPPPHSTPFPKMGRRQSVDSFFN